MHKDKQASTHRIERAVPDDAEAIVLLQRRAYRSEAILYDDDTIPPLRETVGAVREVCTAQLVLKATIDGAIVGAVRAHQEDGTCHVGRLIVDPDVQNRGLGSALLRAIEQHCALGTRLELFTGHRSERNLYLYHKHGYREFRRETINPSLTFVYLEKLLVGRCE